MSSIKSSPMGAPPQHLELDTTNAQLKSEHTSPIPVSAITSVSTTPTTDGEIGPVRRKPSRRANTAERRATHNAVERQRRETLNGRFLDLAGKLPNLAAVRRPSKSAIVNSSIALIHQQRRARGIAARELRLLFAEADALRHEVNEWRERARVAPLDEPPRSADFHVLMSVEEVGDESGEEERAAWNAANEDQMLEEDGEEDLLDTSAHIQQQSMPVPQQHQQHQMQMPLQPPQQQQQLPNPTALALHLQQQALNLGMFDVVPTLDSTKAAWLLQQQQQQQQQTQAHQWAQLQAAAALFTPPPAQQPTNTLVAQAQQAFLANYQRNVASLAAPAPASPASSGSGGSYSPPTFAWAPPPAQAVPVGAGYGMFV